MNTWTCSCGCVTDYPVCPFCWAERPEPDDEIERIERIDE